MSRGGRGRGAMSWRGLRQLGDNVFVECGDQLKEIAVGTATDQEWYNTRKQTHMKRKTIVECMQHSLLVFINQK